MKLANQNSFILALNDYLLKKIPRILYANEFRMIFHLQKLKNYLSSEIHRS